ncbi:D-alanyl-D-alanine carboxypeptidase family protein [Nocardia camponoti]|uniref:D-alanyl-D-alanine carboxypeptidase n=1 Tax=Nocardia camponoti TaxID=1616106 RepID=A0A917Q912_9NOCA|nr:D-alanyl-D-alanine carboxypeptidase [Nocardia camponoti]GGK35988.1 D-alanyl-D-alanine carboxypeptidase [Nocardia camponoti]
MRTFAKVLHAVVAGVVLVGVGHGVTAAAPTGSADGILTPLIGPGPADVAAPGAALADGITGTVLWSRDANTPRPIASITKVMTAFVVITSGDLERPVTVPTAAIDYCVRNDGSTAGLRAGEVLPARELLYGLLLPSGCDAAYTLAESFGPGQDAFIGRMNDAARVMGLGGTNFTDPSGLPVPTDFSNSSTPNDVVTMGVRAMMLPLFREIVAARTHFVPDGPANAEHHWATTNELLTRYPGAIGIKTGSTDAAGYCLLFEAVRAGVPLIGVVLHDANSGEATRDAEKILNWVYDPLTRVIPG